MRTLATVTAGALGVWLGIHAIRAFLAALVWNVAEDVPATQLALVGLVIWLVGMGGWLGWKLFGPRLAAPVLGIGFAVSAVLRQAVHDELWTPVFAILALILWLW